MKLHHLILLWAVFLVSHAGFSSAKAAPPNIVILLADDLGWADVSYHGGYVKTPNIDRLKNGGVELDRFYVYKYCSERRAVRRESCGYAT